MFDIMIVQEALKNSRDLIVNPVITSDVTLEDESSETSLLIHDIFGGEILKTHMKKGWHFYNRIDGQRIDLAKQTTRKAPRTFKFEDIPASPDETYNYFTKEDYARFFMRFVRAFEEYVGLEHMSPGLTA